MMKHVVLCLFSLSVFVFSDINLFAQCPSGTIGVTGSGCGCLSGCNLTSIGGPNCSPAVTGNCSGGELPMFVDITVPAGCTYTVNAVMQNRTGGCTSSGADGGDQLKVDISGGSKGFQVGAANASITDNLTLTGPGTIRVSGTANRADEIITYSTVSSGATCVACLSSLPVELISFDASQVNQAVKCNWTTQSEVNSDYFTISHSTDGITFEPIGNMKAAGNSTALLAYTLFDYNPSFNVVNYYKLTQTDLNGETRLSEIRAVQPIETHELTCFPNPTNGSISITGNKNALASAQLFDVSGKEIRITVDNLQAENTVQINNLSVGVYTLYYFNNQRSIAEKIIVIP